MIVALTLQTFFFVVISIFSSTQLSFMPFVTKIVSYFAPSMYVSFVFTTMKVSTFNKIFFRLWMICYKLTVFNSKDSFHFSFFEANRVDNCIYNSKTRRAEKKNKNGIQIQIQTKPACNTDSTMRSELRIVHIQLQVSQMR